MKQCSGERDCSGGQRDSESVPSISQAKEKQRELLRKRYLPNSKAGVGVGVGKWASRRRPDSAGG